MNNKINESKGLGDTIHKFTTATGIKKVVDVISEKDYEKVLLVMCYQIKVF